MPFFGILFYPVSVHFTAYLWANFSNYTLCFLYLTFHSESQILIYTVDIDKCYGKCNSYVILILSTPEKQLALDTKHHNTVLSENFLNIGTANKSI